MEVEATPRARIAAALAVLYLVWGSTFLAIRVVVETMPPLTSAGLRWVLAGGLLLWWKRVSPRAPARVWAWSATLAVLLVAASNGGVTWAETRVSSGLAALAIATVSPWLVVFEALRPGGRLPSRTTTAGVVLGVLGVTGLVDPSAPVDPAAFAVLLGAACVFALGTTLARLWPDVGPPGAPTARQMLSGGVILGASGLLAGEAPWAATPSTTSLAAIVWLAVMGSVMGFSLYSWLLRVAPPAVVGTYSCANPIVALALGALVAGEPLTPRTAVAAAVVVLGVALVVVGQADTSPMSRLVDWWTGMRHAWTGRVHGSPHRSGAGGLVEGPGPAAAKAR